MIARQWGYRDWNTFHAAIGNRAAKPFELGQIVSGHYLGQKFTGEIIGLQKFGDAFRVALDLFEPVDVVTFDSFSAFRKRINAVINLQGESQEKTSNGKPQLSIKPDQ